MLADDLEVNNQPDLVTLTTCLVHVNMQQRSILLPSSMSLQINQAARFSALAGTTFIVEHNHSRTHTQSYYRPTPAHKQTKTADWTCVSKRERCFIWALHE